jgi:hypothetical protein
MVLGTNHRLWYPAHGFVPERPMFAFYGGPGSLSQALHQNTAHCTVLHASSSATSSTKPSTQPSQATPPTVASLSRLQPLTRYEKPRCSKLWSAEQRPIVFGNLTHQQPTTTPHPVFKNAPLQTTASLHPLKKHPPPTAVTLSRWQPLR